MLAAGTVKSGDFWSKSISLILECFNQFLCVNIFWVFVFCLGKPAHLCIVGDITGGGFEAVAADRWKVTGDR